MQDNKTFTTKDIVSFTKKYLNENSEEIKEPILYFVSEITNTDTSRTPCSTITYYCKVKGFMCEYTNENNYCKLTACAYPDVVYRGSNIVKIRILKESEG